MLNIEELKFINTILKNVELQDEKISKLINKIDAQIVSIENNKDCLWSFYWDCGRQGEVEGLFKATKEEIKNAIGKQVYFGEILGKHSEIYGTLDEEDLKLESDDPNIIINAIAIGYNPLEYIEDEN